MLGLPQSTEVRRPLPKAQLYKRLDWTPSQRESFDGDVSRLDFVNWIAPRTLPAVAVGSEVNEIFVVEVSLKSRDFDIRNITLLAKSIPQHIVYLLRHEDEVRLAVYHTKLFVTDWMPAGSERTRRIAHDRTRRIAYDWTRRIAYDWTRRIAYDWTRRIASLQGLTLDAVWVNLVRQIGQLNSSFPVPDSSFPVPDSSLENLTEQIKENEERSRILRQIETLERQMRTTSQPRRQRELYAEIKKLKGGLHGR